MNKKYHNNGIEVKTISQENLENPNYYGISFANVRYDHRLTIAQKLLHTEFSCLTNKFGYCNASNAYFANLYDVDKRTIRRWIEGLKEFGYVNVEEIRNDYGETIERRIFLTDIHSISTPMTFLSCPPDKITTPRTKMSSPQDKNVLHNNTSNNNTSILPPNPLKGGMPVSLKKKTDKVVWDECNGFTVDEEILKGWKETYVAIDVDQKLKEIHQYCLANPRWRKKNWNRTINSWLSKANDKAPVTRLNGPISRKNVEVDNYRWFEGINIPKCRQKLLLMCREKSLKNERGEVINERDEAINEFLRNGSWNSLPMFIRKAIMEYKEIEKTATTQLVDRTEEIRKNWRFLIKSWIKRNNFKREDNPEWFDAIDDPMTGSPNYFKFATEEYFLLDKENKLSEILSNAG